VHSEERLRLPSIRGRDAYAAEDAGLAWDDALAASVRTLETAAKSGGRIGLLVSPMLSCEDAWLLSSFVLGIDPQAELAVGPVPVLGKDKSFPGGFTMCAEKAPNARGVRRVLESLAKGRAVADAAGFEKSAAAGAFAAALVTGNYPSAWVTPALRGALARTKLIVIDTLPSDLTAMADVVLPGATWVEKAGSFENAKGRLQAFDRAIDPVEFAKSECQIALDLKAARAGANAATYNAQSVRSEMARHAGLERFATELHVPASHAKVAGDMVLVEI
jgi:NADH-quinone oxidoreductase subunit G